MCRAVLFCGGRYEEKRKKTNKLKLDAVCCVVFFSSSVAVPTSEECTIDIVVIAASVDVNKSTRNYRVLVKMKLYFGVVARKTLVRRMHIHHTSNSARESG